MPKRPNIVFVFPDEFRRQAMGFMGEDPVVTPNLDRLAAQGTTFTRAYSARPVCSPARACLLTGTYPHTHGVTTNCNSATAPPPTTHRHNKKPTSRFTFMKPTLVHPATFHIHGAQIVLDSIQPRTPQAERIITP